MTLGLLLLAFGAGCLLALQVGLNNILRGAVQSPVSAALLSFAIGTTLLVVAALVGREAVPSAPVLRGVDWWSWTGGLIGAFYVVVTVVVIPRLGAAAAIGLIVTGQLLTSLALDAAGGLGVPVVHLGPGRVAGALLVLTGVTLITRAPAGGPPAAVGDARSEHADERPIPPQPTTPGATRTRRR